MDTQVLGIILSGQLLLVAWQIFKELSDRRAKKKESKDGLHEMVFSLYRDNLRQRILSLDKRLKDSDPNIRIELLELKEDMKIYIANKGNGEIKNLYIHLARKVRIDLGEDAFALLWIENLETHSSKS